MISTDRLILRHWQLSDLAPFSVLNASAKVCEYFPKTLTKEESDQLANNIIRHFDKHGFGLYAVELKSTKEFIGFTGLNIPSFSAPFMPSIEIGWRLSDKHWGKGYATEAAHAVLNYGFSNLKLKEIVSFTVPHNQRSLRVMQKLGMTHNSQDDFHHPKVPQGHILSKHVLYRIKNKFLN